MKTIIITNLQISGSAKNVENETLAKFENEFE